MKFSLHLFWAVRNGVWHFWEFAGSSFKVPTPCQTNFCLWGRLSHGVRVKKSKVKTLFWADLTISTDTKECLHLVLRIHKFRIIDDTKCIWKKQSWKSPATALIQIQAKVKGFSWIHIKDMYKSILTSQLLSLYFPQKTKNQFKEILQIIQHKPSH